MEPSVWNNLHNQLTALFDLLRTAHDDFLRDRVRNGLEHLAERMDEAQADAQAHKSALLAACRAELVSNSEVCRECPGCSSEELDLCVLNRSKHYLREARAQNAS